MKKGTIIQIIDENHHWFPCLLIVDEIKSWGVQAYIALPTNDKEPNNPAYIRLETKEFEIVGEANILAE